MFTIVLMVGSFIGGWIVGKNMSKATISAIKAEIDNLESKAKGLATVAAVDVMAAVTYIKGKVS